MTRLQAVELTVAFLIAIGIAVALGVVVIFVIDEVRGWYRRRGHGGYVVIRPRVDDPPERKVA